jgi:membrane carboxypeptidase/penicillin-binding protein
MMKATQLYPPRNPDQTQFDAPGGIEFAKIDAESLELANDACVNTFEEAFIAGTAPTTSCSLHGLRISDVIDKTVAEPAKEVGKGVNKVFQGVGKVLGSLFGSGKDKAPN